MPLAHTLRDSRNLGDSAATAGSELIARRIDLRLAPVLRGQPEDCIDPRWN